MGPGTLYSTIQRLVDLDLIEETEGSGEPSDHESRRRYYRLTGDGRQTAGGRGKPDGVRGAGGTEEKAGNERRGVARCRTQ